MPLKKKNGIKITPQDMAKFMALYMTMKQVEDMMEEDYEEEDSEEECGCEMKKPKMMKKSK